MKNMKRAIRRHHRNRIRKFCENYIRNIWNSRVDLYLTTRDYKRIDGIAVSYVIRLNPDWRERYESWVRKTVQDEASHRPHFCQMCRKPRYDRNRDDLYLDDEC